MLKIATKQPAQHCRQTSLLHNQTKCAFLLVTFPQISCYVWNKLVQLIIMRHKSEINIDEYRRCTSLVNNALIQLLAILPLILFSGSELLIVDSYYRRQDIARNSQQGDDFTYV